MPIVRIRLLAVAALVVGLILPAAAVAGEAKEFKVHNFKWTLPDEWEFQEVPAALKQGGHVIAAVSPGRDVLARAYVSRTDLPASERAQELQDHMGAFLRGGVKHKKIIESTLSGIDAHVALGQGKHKSGATGHVRLYVISKGHNIYHLEVLTYNGSHVERRDEINALRKGFRLIKGGGPEDLDEAFDEFPPMEESGDDDEDEGDGDEDDDGGNWPAKGPKRDGTKLSFPGFNVEWDLKGTPLEWMRPCKDLEKVNTYTKRGVTYSPLVQVEGSVERRKQEFEKDTPDRNRLRGWFFSYRMLGGRDSGEKLRSTELQEEIQRMFGLGEIKSSDTRVFPDQPAGNFGRNAQLLRITAPLRGGQRATVMHYEVQLKGQLYFWRFLLTGHTDTFKSWAPIIGNMMKNNITFPDNVDNVPGPIVPPSGLFTFSGERGKYHKPKKKKLKTIFVPGGIQFKIPGGMYELDLPLIQQRGSNPDIRAAVEWRSKDGQTYVYFDIHTWPAAMLQRRQKSLDDKAQEHVSAWEAGAGENVVMGKGDKALKKGGTLLRFRGDWTYRFTAERKGVPYVELGSWSKEKTFVVWARLQYGGKNAEKNKEAKKIVAAIKKGLKLK